MKMIDKRVQMGLILSVIGTVLCPIFGFFPLTLSIIAIRNTTKQNSTIIKWVFILLIIEGLLLIAGAVHLMVTLLNAEV